MILNDAVSVLLLVVSEAEHGVVLPAGLAMVWSVVVCSLAGPDL